MQPEGLQCFECLYPILIGINDNQIRTERLDVSNTGILCSSNAHFGRNNLRRVQTVICNPDKCILEPEHANSFCA